MAYPNYYNPYPQQMYQPPMPDQLAQLRQGQYPQVQTAQPQSSPMIWVQGEAAARSYMVAPGNTVMLMDSDASTFYLKTADGSGVPQPLRIFDYTERTAAPRTASAAPQAAGVEYVTRQEFDALAARIEEIGGVSAPEKKTAKKKEETE